MVVKVKVLSDPINGDLIDCMEICVMMIFCVMNALTV